MKKKQTKKPAKKPAKRKPAPQPTASAAKAEGGGMDALMQMMASANKDDRAAAFKEMVTRLFSHEKSDLLMSSNLSETLSMWLAKNMTASHWFYDYWKHITAKGKWVVDNRTGDYRVKWNVNFGGSHKMKPEAWNVYHKMLMALTVSKDGGGRKDILMAMSNAEQRMLAEMLQQQGTQNPLQRFLS